MYGHFAAQLSQTDAQEFCLSAVPSKTLNITEGIPMMTLAHSAAKTEFDPLVTPLLPDREPRGKYLMEFVYLQYRGN